MKKLMVSAALLLLAGASYAVPVNYTLTGIDYENSFGVLTPSCQLANDFICALGGTAVDDGAGNITLSGLTWELAGNGNHYIASISGTTTLAPTMTPVTNPVNSLPAGSVITRTGGSCTTISIGTADLCDAANVRSGFADSFNFYTGQHSGGTTCGSPATNFNAINRCRVDLSVAGDTLTLLIKRALSESTTSGSYQLLTFTFKAVPVPGAVWLLGSALGVLGLARRKLA